MFINWRGVLAGVSVGFIVLLVVLSIVDLTTGVFNEWWLQADQSLVLSATALIMMVSGIYLAYRAVKQTRQEHSR